MLSKVSYVNFYSLTAIIFYWKVIPLDMSMGVGINSKTTIIFSISDLNDYIQISPFEVAIECWFLINFHSRIHAFEQSSVFTVKSAMKFSEVCSKMGEVGID